MDYSFRPQSLLGKKVDTISTITEKTSPTYKFSEEDDVMERELEMVRNANWCAQEAPKQLSRGQRRKLQLEMKKANQMELERGGSVLYTDRAANLDLLPISKIVPVEDVETKVNDKPSSTKQKKGSSKSEKKKPVREESVSPPISKKDWKLKPTPTNNSSNKTSEIEKDYTKNHSSKVDKSSLDSVGEFERLDTVKAQNKPTSGGKFWSTSDSDSD
jgi:hypothetical protein